MAQHQEPLYPELNCVDIPDLIKEEIPDSKTKKSNSNPMSPVIIAMGIPFIVASPLLIQIFDHKSFIGPIYSFVRFIGLLWKNDASEQYWLEKYSKSVVSSWIRFATQSAMLISLTSGLVIKMSMMDSPTQLLIGPLMSVVEFSEGASEYVQNKISKYPSITIGFQLATRFSFVFSAAWLIKKCSQPWI